MPPNLRDGKFRELLVHTVSCIPDEMVQLGLSPIPVISAAK